MSGKSLYNENSMTIKSESSSGQIGLVVLLITAVVLTIGISTATQSIIETKTARQETESTQTFNAAEQGVEQALSQLNPDMSENQTFTVDGHDVNVQVQKLTNNFVTTLLNGNSMQLDLTNVTNISLSWSVASECNTRAALIVAFVGAGQIERYAYGSDCGGSPRSDGFSGLNCTATDCSVNSISVPVGATIARIKAVYNDTNVTTALTSPGDLPVQGYLVSSKATRQGSEEIRQIQVRKPVAALPSIFDYALFSGTSNLEN